MIEGPLALVGRVAAMLQELGIPYALGGSLASSLVGEPRSTVDIDIAIALESQSGEALLARVITDFYVPLDRAREAIRACSCVNLIDTARGLKVDLFVLGRGLLDRMQIQRRTAVSIPEGRGTGLSPSMRGL